MSRNLVARFWRNVEVAESCWRWQGPTTATGYGVLSDGPTSRGAHRFAYELLVEPIPQGLVLDHLCRNRGCVNPDHLEPVTQAENLRRGHMLRGDAHPGRQKTHCPSGHAYDEVNTRWYRGHRYCKACGLERNRQARSRARAA